CDIFPRITPANVKIVYAQTGLGYAGRPGGPMPTITVSLQNLPFQFFFLRGLMGFHDFQIPSSTVSLTAEDLSSRAPSFCLVLLSLTAGESALDPITLNFWICGPKMPGRRRRRSSRNRFGPEIY